MITDVARSADGTEIVYHRTGSGPPVVMVPGVLAPTALYEPIALLLSEHYQVVLVERRGYGVSGDGQRPATFAMQAMDIAAVLAAVGEPSFVFGHSAGGIVTLNTLPVATPPVRALALYEPPVSLTGPRLAPVLERCRALVADGRGADAIVAFLTDIGAAGGTDALRAVATTLEHRAAGLILDLECMTSMSNEAGRWTPGDTPILLASGSEADTYAKESLDLLQQELPVLDTVVFAGQGHQPSDPEPVAAALHAFFAAH
ncbi:MAG TPA: alpha/beta fold hydrolase [Pseudonocardiaceae bacterium]|jgi:pimeloyl-ACP methyl ester carboxylesterase|nr:alpha/beta fold hydrolase [Pseudonocardiaceae bacterium]